MDAMRDGAGNVAVQNPPPVMGDDEEAIEHAESQRRHGEEVHRGNRFSVVIQESSPTLAGSGFRGAFLIQRNTVRDAYLRPVCAASTLKDKCN
jgi:hypothetical protein